MKLYYYLSFRVEHGLESSWTHRWVKMMELFKIFNISRANQSMAFLYVAISLFKINVAKQCEHTKLKNWPKVNAQLHNPWRGRHSGRIHRISSIDFPQCRDGFQTFSSNLETKLGLCASDDFKKKPIKIRFGQKRDRSNLSV